jgi:methionine-R-sulfoxide reductase
MKIFSAIVISIISLIYTLPALTAEEKVEYKKTDEAVKKLDEMQYKVTQHSGTEPPFKNQYWDFWEEGIYVDVVTGEPLFSSADKYDAGNGWPSFHRPIRQESLIDKPDYAHGMIRTEVKSKSGDSHLGHVFDDGKPEEGGKHYCINSSALKFVPKKDLILQGYGEFLYLFENNKKK